LLCYKKIVFSSPGVAHFILPLYASNKSFVAPIVSSNFPLEYA
jgi:hypothetical protein